MYFCSIFSFTLYQTYLKSLIKDPLFWFLYHLHLFSLLFVKEMPHFIINCFKTSFQIGFSRVNFLVQVTFDGNHMTFYLNKPRRRKKLFTWWQFLIISSEVGICFTFRILPHLLESGSYYFSCLNPKYYFTIYFNSLKRFTIFRIWHL